MVRSIQNMRGTAGTYGACVEYSAKNVPYWIRGSIAGNKKIKEKALQKYYADPIYCKFCNKIIEVRNERPSRTKKKKFCNHSCAAKYHKNRKGTGDKKYNWKEVQKYYNKVKSYKKCIAKFGFSSNTLSNAIKAGKVKLIDRKIPLNKILIKNSTYHRGALKRRLLKEGLLRNECYVCGLGPEWNSKKLVLVIDHKNGVRNDNRIKNLRIICPNCDSQTNTYCGRNINKNGGVV